MYVLVVVVGVGDSGGFLVFLDDLFESIEYIFRRLKPSGVEINTFQIQNDFLLIKLNYISFFNFDILFSDFCLMLTVKA